MNSEANATNSNLARQTTRMFDIAAVTFTAFGAGALLSPSTDFARGLLTAGLLMCVLAASARMARPAATRSADSQPDALVTRIVRIIAPHARKGPRQGGTVSVLGLLESLHQAHLYEQLLSLGIELDELPDESPELKNYRLFWYEYDFALLYEGSMRGAALEIRDRLGLPTARVFDYLDPGQHGKLAGRSIADLRERVVRRTARFVVAICTSADPSHSDLGKELKVLANRYRQIAARRRAVAKLVGIGKDGVKFVRETFPDVAPLRNGPGYIEGTGREMATWLPIRPQLSKSQGSISG